MFFKILIEIFEIFASPVSTSGSEFAIGFRVPQRLFEPVFRASAHFSGIQLDATSSCADQVSDTKNPAAVSRGV